MEIVKMLVPQNKYSIKCPYEMEPEFIIIHNTANDASALNEISYMIGNNNKVSFHCAIDDERIVQGVPFNRNTWNATDGSNGEGNRRDFKLAINDHFSINLSNFFRKKVRRNRAVVLIY